MKINSKSLALLFVGAVSAITLTACGGGGTSQADSRVSGNTYSFESCTVDGEDATETITAMYSEQSFAFDDDGICTQTIVWSDEFAEAMGSADPVEQSGTYEEKDDTVTVTLSSDEEETVLEFTVDGETLTMDDDGSVMVYKLQ